MNQRILITYATRAGATAEVAAAIAEVLSARGFTADVRPVKDKPSIEGYQAVVVGSAIRMSSWLPEAVDFVKTHRTQLSRVPTAFFTVHMLNRGDSEASRQARQAYTAAVRQIAAPTYQIFFEGSMDYDKLKFLDRTLAKAVEKQSDAREGDFRDWDKIRAWARAIFAEAG
jgi:menaquinone-dependent protoporphyrinogen oxidase